jgi:hypothetical protein
MPAGRQVLQPFLYVRKPPLILLIVKALPLWIHQLGLLQLPLGADRRLCEP